MVCGLWILPPFPRHEKSATGFLPHLCRKATDCAFNLQVRDLPAKDGVALLTEGLRGVKPYVRISFGIFFRQARWLPRSHGQPLGHVLSSARRDGIIAPHDRYVDPLRLLPLRFFRDRLRA